MFKGVGEGGGVISQGHPSFPNEATFMGLHLPFSHLPEPRKQPSTCHQINKVINTYGIRMMMVLCLLDSDGFRSPYRLKHTSEGHLGKMHRVHTAWQYTSINKIY
ncbi:hypothetical protein GDO86_001223 [Hymenochirus boettgeri]|uniref:Uncharacterized protein n=1 Tax=Hymenochirus boettgeri TaxID=247094 RepID=A0A8T2KCR8_9PIPI|nr:hypothetical protein GDO86_001223 [Hymenochirus boettgeri]